MTPKQEEALRDYLQEAIVPLIEQVLVKKLGQAMTFAAQEVVSPQRKPLTDEQEREAFEAHWYSFYHSGSVSARSDGSYVHPHVQRAWEAWQARAAQE